MARITGNLKNDNPLINNSNVEDFFKHRANKIKELDYLRAVMYQDNNPQLVLDRNRAEKEKLLPLIPLNKESKILDVGCGTGRWLDHLDKNFKNYHGVDLSIGFIEYAKSRFTQDNISFSVGKAQDLDEEKKYNILLCMGVIIYLNDEDVIQFFKKANNLMESNSSTLIIREPIALMERLTLVDEYSQDLDQYYNAIYRTKDELIDLFNKYLPSFEVLKLEKLFEGSLNNRIETQQYYFILRN